MRFAAQASMLLHPRTSLDCDAVQGRLLGRLCGTAPEAILVAFDAGFNDHLLTVHRPSAAVQVAERIQRQYKHAVGLPSVARAQGVSAHLLRKDFASTYGMTVREYAERVRITHAIDGLMDAKSKPWPEMLGIAAQRISTGRF